MFTSQVQNLDKLEIKREILTEQEIQESIKSLNVYCEDEEDASDLFEKFKCHICYDFAHNPINCKCSYYVC